jgi:predicted DNA-binding transcriptional regulator AlpA
MVSFRLRVREAAQYLGLSKSTLDKRRLSGLAPVYSKIGGTVVYDTRDLDALLAETKRRSTSEPDPVAAK